MSAETDAVPMLIFDERAVPPLASTLKLMLCAAVPLVGLMPLIHETGVLALQTLQPISPIGGVYVEEKLPPAFVGDTVAGENEPGLQTRFIVLPELSVAVTVMFARSAGPLPLITKMNVDGWLKGGAGE